MSKEKSVNISAKQNSSFKLITLLGILLIVLIVALFANLFYLGSQTDQDRSYVKAANDLRVYSQSIPTNASKFLAGDETSFTTLSKNYESFDSTWAHLKQDISNDQVDAVDSAWTKLKGDMNLLLTKKNELSTIHAAIEQASISLKKLKEISQATLSKLQQEQSDIRLINQMQQQSLLLESIQLGLTDLLTDYSIIDKSGSELAKKVTEFNSIINMMQQSGVLPTDAQKILLTATPLLSELNTNIKSINETTPKILTLQDINGKIYKNSSSLLDASSQLASAIENSTSQFSNNALLNYIIAVFIIIVIIVMAIIVEKNTRRRLEATATENAVNQEAILQLLDEIGDLADGDLTVNATVSEAFTGAIADSINYSIEQLRGLVQTINKTSVQVSDTAENSQNLAMNLAEAAEHQAGEIAGVSTAISEMAVSIDEVSSTAHESEGVAKRSVEIAHNGSKIVHNTIAGMDTIREQIQDTSKRIKRLGESSQEIGDIVGLIDDIAEQTNILALNAAIQASMAGDAGRGFAVVADEVQRLAERSSSATKQIETLVKAIQTDTNEAVISMEQTTSEVVRGAKLAENAGVALEEIETVSQALSKLIQTISNAARQQASTAAHISKTMDVIQEITSQTSSGSTETAMTIGHLTTLSKDMRKSVEGFKLPND